MQKLSNVQLQTASIETIARSIRNGMLTPSEVLEVHIARIKKVNAKINGLFADRFELARDETAALDEELRAGLSILEGGDGVDTDVVGWPSVSVPDLSSIRYALVESVSGGRASVGMRAALQRGGKALVNRGTSSFVLSKRFLDKALAVWSTAMSSASSKPSRFRKTFHIKATFPAQTSKELLVGLGACRF